MTQVAAPAKLSARERRAFFETVTGTAKPPAPLWARAVAGIIVSAILALGVGLLTWALAAVVVGIVGVVTA